jgi:hypothetical protein
MYHYTLWQSSVRCGAPTIRRAKPLSNIFPTKALALATVALAIVHWAFVLRGRVVVGVAGLWAVATTWMVTMFIVSHWLTAFIEAVVRLVHILTVAGAACGLCILAWHRPSRDLAEAMAFSWVDTKEVRPVASKFYAFLNDENRPPATSIVGALRDYDIVAALWSRRDEVRQELAA